MARCWVNLVGVSPLLLGMVISVPQMVTVPGVLAQSSQNRQPTEAQQLYNEGERLRRQGTNESFQQALAKFQEALPLFRANGDRNGEAENLESIGNVYLGLRQGQQALDYYQQALQIYRQRGDSTEERLRRRYGEARTLTNIGAVYRTFFRFSAPRFGEATTIKDIGELSGSRFLAQLALNSYQQALPIWRELGDRSGEADTLNYTADVYQHIRQSQLALEFYQQAIQIYQEVGDSIEERLRQRSGEAATLNDIAFVYRVTRQRQLALSFYQQALKIYREMGDRAGEARILNNIEDMVIGRYFSSFISSRFPRFGESTTIKDIGELSGDRLKPYLAINFYQQVLLIWREGGNSTEERLRQRKREAITLNAIAGVYQSMRQSQQALGFYQQAIQIYRELGDRKGEAETLRSIGVMYLIMEQPQQALNYLQQALPILREVENSTQGRIDQLFDEASTLSDIGSAYLKIGQPEQALNYLQQALPIWREQGNSAGEANTLNNIARVYRDMGQPEQALNYAQQASAISGGMGDRKEEADIPNTTANIYRRNIRQYQQALSFYQQALPIYRAVNSPVYRAVGNPPEERLRQRSGEAAGGFRSIVQPTEKVFILNSIGRVYYSIGQQSIFIRREVNGGNSQQTVGRCGNSSRGNVGSNSIAGGSIFTPLCSSPPPNSSGDVR